MAAVPLEDLYAIDTSFVDTQEEEEVARQLTASQARVTELEVQLKDASKQLKKKNQENEILAANSEVHPHRIIRPNMFAGCPTCWRGWSCRGPHLWGPRCSHLQPLAFLGPPFMLKGVTRDQVDKLATSKLLASHGATIVRAYLQEGA
mmetsp:Transcript_40125/g.94025  ORF Transcript_40125/g.94025 Transcript_40125/m.94025 type:complete len:148 (+) Transcript_40125:11-454(+)